MNGFKHVVYALTATLSVFFLTTVEASSPPDGSGSRPDHVTLQLKWTHQFQFAGYYAALEKGYYRDVGLDVTIVQAKPGSETMQDVIEGKAEFGVGTTDVMLLRARGKPVVVLAVIFQHSPLVLLARKDAGIQSIHDLNDKRVMIEPHSAELFAYLKNEGVPASQMKILPHSFDTNNLIKGTVDAMSAYSTDEPFDLEKAGIEIMKFSPRSGGIDYYGDLLFTTESQIRNHPKRVKRFLEASLKGWDYALKNPEEVVDIILSRYPTQKTREHLLFEAAQMMRLIHPELIEIGYMYPGRWKHIAETYIDLGMLSPDFSLDGLVYSTKNDLKNVYRAIGVLLALTISLTAILGYIFRLNRRLRHQIRERERVELELGESKRDYRFLAENLQDILWTFDMQLNATYVSPSIRTVLGFTPEERMQRNLSEQLTRESFEFVNRSLAEERKKDEQEGVSPDRSITLALDFNRKDGSSVCLETTMSFIRDDSSNPIGILGLSRDITRRKQAEEALKVSEEKYRTVVEESFDGIFVQNGTAITFANARLHEMLGYDRGELVGLNHWLVYHPDYQDLVRSRAQARLRGESLTSKYELDLLRKDGTSFPGEVSAKVVFFDNQPGIQVWIRDLSEQKLLEKQIVEAQKMEALGTLAGGIAHDFNNLLQVIIGYGELLLTRMKRTNPLYTDLERVYKAGQRGADLVKSILDFSRRTEPDLQPVNINDDILSIRTLLSRTLPKMIDVQLNLAPDLKRINADPAQMQQVLLNLAVNSRDAMPDGGRLVFETENIFLDEEFCSRHLEVKPGHYVRISVSDTGCGMDKEVAAHVFEPFYTTKEVDQGTGLGLSSVFGIVKVHGGHISCYSEPGIGTTFKIDLPICEEEIETHVSEVGEMPSLSGTETLLIVDDEKHIQDLARRLLAPHGYKMLFADNGLEGLKIYQENESDISLVILDLIMPVMDGRECLGKLLELNPNVMILIASGYSPDGPTRDTLALGAKGFIEKPFRLEQMIGKIRQVLDSH